MSDRSTLAPHVGRQVTFTALGKEWTTARLTRGRWRRFLDEYAAKVLPDPRDVAVGFLQKLPRDLPCYDVAASTIVADARNEATAGLTPNSPRVLSLLNDLDGSSYLLMLALEPNHPGITHDEAWEVAVAIGQDRIADVLLQAQGARPTPKGEGPDLSQTGQAPAPGMSASGGSDSTASSPANAG